MKPASSRWRKTAPRRVASVDFACTHCRAAIGLRIPALSTRLDCPGCGQSFGVSTVHLDPVVVLLVPEGRAPAPEPPRSVPPEIRKAFARLGLEPCFDLARVRAHYRRQIARHHPDKNATRGEELRRKADAKTRQLIRAYEQLCAFLAS